MVDNSNGTDNQSQKGAEDRFVQFLIYNPLICLVIFRKIFVGGISSDVTNEDLQQHFSQFGDVAQAQVKIDRATGRSRG